MTDRLPELPKIEVDAEVAEAAQMPDDLDANVFGPYAVPDPIRRRRAARVYVLGAAVVAIGIGFGLPSGMWLLVAALLVIAGYHWVGGVHLSVREHEALTVANRAMIGPASSSSTWSFVSGGMTQPSACTTRPSPNPSLNSTSW